MERYDLCVVGAGPAGIAGAFRAVDLGKRVALIDGGPLGGAGIFDGALSSKTLWHLSTDYARACRTDRGYDGAALRASWPAVRAQVDAACREAQALIVRQLTAYARPGAGRGSIDHIVGRGVFVGLDTLDVSTVEGSRRIEARATCSSTSTI